MSDSYYRGDLLGLWAGRRPTITPAPLAVRSRWYRRIIAEGFERLLPPGSRTILSLGSGTGRMEAALVRRGFDVTASDVSSTALQLCRAAGLRAIRFDIRSPPPGLGEFDGLYADGLLGHLPSVEELAGVWKTCCGVCRGVFVLSNDLADSDDRTDVAVHGNPAARFVRPPAGAFERSACATKLWRKVWADVVTYRRPGRGLRRRELLILRAVTDARRDDTKAI